MSYCILLFPISVKMLIEVVKLVDTVLERHPTSPHVDSTAMNTGITGGSTVSTVASSLAADISMYVYVQYLL